MEDNLYENFQTNASKEQEKVKKPQLHEKQGLTLISSLLILVFIGLTSLGGHQIYQIKKTITEIESSTNDLEQAKKANITDTTSVGINFKSRFYAQKKQNQLFWTNIIKNIESNIPDKNKLKINSINGTEQGAINLHISSTPSSLNPLIDTANLITTYKTKPFFDAVFIPSISNTINQQGLSQTVYNLRLNYVKDEAEETAIDILAPINSPTIKVPTTNDQDDYESIEPILED